jgi:hypothetical protein
MGDLVSPEPPIEPSGGVGQFSPDQLQPEETGQIPVEPQVYSAPLLPAEFAPVDEPAPAVERRSTPRGAVPPAVGDPMSPEGRAAIAASFANDPAQQAAVAAMKAGAAAAKDAAPVRPRPIYPWCWASCESSRSPH